MAAIKRAGLLVVTGCVAACSAGPSATTTTTSTDPSGGVHTVTVPATRAPSAAPTRKIDFIRATNFGAQEWTDPLRDNAKVALSGGKGSANGVSYAVGPQAIAYADADGDGLEEAMVPLVVTGSNGAVMTYLYIWLWDAQAKKAVQVPDPVGEYGGCTNALAEFGPGRPMGFQVREYIRDTYDNQACSKTPPHEFTRTVGVADKGLVMTKPVVAYGGICYQTYRDPSDLPKAAPIRVAPKAGAAVAQQAQHLYFTIPDKLRGRTWPQGWEQVSWLTDDLKKQGYFWGICGFRWNG